MWKSCENNSAMLKSADQLGSADTAGRYAQSLTLEQLNDKAKRQKEQRKIREKIEEQEHQSADIKLQNALSHLGVSFNEKELKNTTNNDFEINKELSTADKIKNYKEQLTQQGKSQMEILNLLITQFENEEAVSTWVENWRNFQKLHQFAEAKPPKERQAIQKIIAQADFTSETAFTTSLTQIAQSTEISQTTKLEISRKFSGENVFSIADLDHTLKEVKNQKQQIENAISTKSQEKKSLNSEIENLENELENLSLNDPKRQDLEQKLEQKKADLKNTESELDRLEKGKPKDVSFSLRQGFSAKLNPDGSRSIKINSRDFAIKIPSNKLPFTDTKNLRSVNLAFPFLALKNQNIADIIFSSNLENNAVPNKQNRQMGHQVLSVLGYDDSRILSENDIQQLNSDLSRLTAIPAKSGKENLIAIGVYDVASQSLDKNRFKEVLGILRTNRGMEKELVWERLKN